MWGRRVALHPLQSPAKLINGAKIDFNGNLDPVIYYNNKHIIRGGGGGEAGEGSARSSRKLYSRPQLMCPSPPHVGSEGGHWGFKNGASPFLDMKN